MIPQAPGPINQKALIAYSQRDKIFAQALKLAVRLYKNDKRQYTGIAYASHPMTVASLLLEVKADSATLVTAALQDVLSKTQFTEQALRLEFEAAIVDAVLTLTPPKQPKSSLDLPNDPEAAASATRYAEVLRAASPEVKTVKIASLLDLVCATPRKMMGTPASQAFVAQCNALLPSLESGDAELFRRLRLIVQRALIVSPTVTAQ